MTTLPRVRRTLFEERKLAWEALLETLIAFNAVLVQVRALGLYAEPRFVQGEEGLLVSVHCLDENKKELNVLEPRWITE